MEALLRKQYRLTLEFKGFFGRPKKIEFTFTQGSLRDLLEMKTQLNDPAQVNNWLFNFLMKKTKQSDKLTPKLYSQLNGEEINSITEFLIKTYAKGFFAKVQQQEEEKIKAKETSPTSSFICLILEKTNETTESLMDMTWEQISYLVDGIIWNVNEQSGKKGKERNERLLRLKELKDETKQGDVSAKLKMIEEKMQKIKLNKK